MERVIKQFKFRRRNLLNVFNLVVGRLMGRTKISLIKLCPPSLNCLYGNLEWNLNLNACSGKYV